MSHSQEDFEHMAKELSKEFDNSVDNLREELDNLLENRGRSGRDFNEIVCELDGLLGDNLDKKDNPTWNTVKVFFDQGEIIIKKLRECRKILKRMASLENRL